MYYFIIIVLIVVINRLFVSDLQDDKDLVPEFVNSDGLTCFIKVGAEADHNYQNYILRGEGSKIKKKKNFIVFELSCYENCKKWLKPQK